MLASLLAYFRTFCPQRAARPPSPRLVPRTSRRARPRRLLVRVRARARARARARDTDTDRDRVRVRIRDGDRASDQPQSHLSI